MAVTQYAGIKSDFTMKTARSARVLAVASTLFVLLAGCSKSDGPEARRDTPITGKPSDPPVELKARWQAGKRYVIRTEMTRSAAVRRGGRGPSGQREDRLGQTIAVTVTNAPKDNLGLELELLSLELEITSGNSTIISYGSGSEAAGTLGASVADALDKLIGGRIYCLVSPTNKVLRIDGIKEFMERAEGNAPAPADATRPAQPRRNTTTTTVRNYYTPESLRAILDLSGVPEKFVHIGESWSMQRDIGSGPGGPLVISSTNTFKGWQEHEQKKCARIDVAGVLAPKPSNMVLIQQGKPPPFGNSKVTGHLWFDPALSFPVETVFDQTYAMISAVAPPRPQTNGPLQKSPGTNVPASAVQGTNAPPQTVSSPVHQIMSIKLLEVTTL
jgi:hypothetical protein